MDASSSIAASASDAASSSIAASASTIACASTTASSSIAASSSPSPAAQWYKVFINHRGVDVKKTFARSLYLRLLEKGLRPFLDQDEMQAGYNFPLQIEEAIRSARVHVAIFSPRYADSYWCLRELVHMLESEAPIVPVFYRVTPAEVRWTQGKDGKYAKALKELAEKRTDEGKLRYDSNIIEKWRTALSTVADNSGYELEVRNGEELEMELLDKIVECLSKMLEKQDLHVADYPTGLNSKLKDFEDTVLLQQLQSGKPQVVGIVGLGGVGKTTLAKQFFNKKKSYYLRSCFLSEVKDHAASLNLLQTKLLKELTDKQIDSVDNVHEGKNMLIQALKSSNALIILDDVGHVDQVKALLPVETHDICSGSLILITSRDRGVLRSARVEISSIYTLTGLNTQHSRELFCSHAFSQAYSPPEYEHLINKFLESCDGLPLSLKVHGAHLYGKDKSEWEDELGSLPREVKGSLKISYDDLNEEEQHIFLDIACFLQGQHRDTAISIWNGSGWKGRRGLQNLQDRCLVEIDSRNCIHMHEHLKDLGRDVAEKLYPFRLWRWTQNVMDYLSQQSSVITVRGLNLIANNDYGSILRGIAPQMLRILDTEGTVLESILGTVELSGILWLRWKKYPYSSLPSWISVKNLRYLEVWGSELNTLWKSESESQLAVFLEVLAVISCEKLKSIPGLGYYTKLRWLDVTQCTELEELPSMGALTSLEEFSAFGCVKLKRITGLGQCTKLRGLHVGQCSELEELPNMETLASMDRYYAYECGKLKRITGLGQCTKLRLLNLGECSELEELPSMGALTSLEEFSAVGCVKLKSIRGLGQCTKLRALMLVSARS
eukprot:PITA_34021